MNFKTLLPAIVAVAGFGSLANANPGIRLGVPSYGGTGCPGGSASATLSPDGTSLSVLFDSFQVEAGGYSGRTLDRKSCNLAIPVTVPQGYSISILKIDYRGYTALPYGARADFNVDYFFAGSQGPRASRTFTGPSNDNFLVTDTLVASAQVWSACGADVNLRTNANMSVQSGYGSDNAIATLDSMDIAAGVIYQISWRTCGGGGGGYPNPYPQPDPYPQPYPTPDPYPQPYPQPDPYPQPNPGYGQCRIDQIRDRYTGRLVYIVRDRYANEVGRSHDYYQAEQIRRNAEARGQCDGGSGGGGYPYPRPQPQPYPNPYDPYNPGHGGGGWGSGCSVRQHATAVGITVYQVIDRQGRVVSTMPTASQAYEQARSNQLCFR